MNGQYAARTHPQYPRGNVVYTPDGQIETTMDSYEEAQAYAEALNRWLALKPSQDSYASEIRWIEPDDMTLAAILDRCLVPEQQAEAAMRAVGT